MQGFRGGGKGLGRVPHKSSSSVEWVLAHMRATTESYMTILLVNNPSGPRAIGFGANASIHLLQSDRILLRLTGLTVHISLLFRSFYGIQTAYTSGPPRVHPLPVATHTCREGDDETT